MVFNSPLLTALRDLLRLEAQSLWRNKRSAVPVALFVILATGMLHRRKIWDFLARLHYRATAEEPRLVYRPTEINASLLQDCRTLTKQKYYPLWYLFNGHLQTLKLARANESEVHPIINYERQLLDLPDGGVVSLDWALPKRADGATPSIAEIDPTCRTMIILPGLTGGSGEHYIRCTVDRMLELGWQVVVMNARGCASTPLKTAKLFCCAYTEDLRDIVKYLNKKYDFRASAFIGIGFSMGSNVLVKYLGEQKHDSGLTAGISIGNPFDLVKCSDNLRSSVFYRRTYDAALTHNLKELFFKRSNAHEVFQGHPELDLEALRNSKDLHEFDDRLTRIVFDYETVHHYYTDASSATRIKDIKIPLLCINAEDDPISTAAALPYQEALDNDNVILCVTKSGGHLAFYEGRQPGDETASARELRGKSPVEVWSVKVIAEYAESIRHHAASKLLPA